MITYVILGIIFVLYFVIVASHTHLNSKFPLLWLLFGFVFIATGAFYGEIVCFYEKIPLGFKWILRIILVLGTILCMTLLYKIRSLFHVREKENLSYIIILGAQMKQTGPSLTLKRRIDRAVTYMKENKGTMAVLSGGQGKNEPMSEAKGMYQYMITHGIDQSRMILEEHSVNTYENLMLTTKTVPDMIEKNNKVGIVTSNFHMYRAKKLAEKIGYKEIYCLPSETEFYMLPTAITREIAAIIKDFLVGNL